MKIDLENRTEVQYSGSSYDTKWKFLATYSNRNLTPGLESCRVSLSPWAWVNPGLKCVCDRGLSHSQRLAAGFPYPWATKMQRFSASFCLLLFLPSRLCFALLFSLPLVLIPPLLVIFHMPELYHISDKHTNTHTSLGMHAYLRHTLLIHWIIHRNTHTHRHLMSHTQMQ